MEYIEHVIIPLLSQALRYIKIFCLARQADVLQSTVLRYLEKQYFGAPLYPLWPENPYMIRVINQFILRCSPHG